MTTSLYAQLLGTGFDQLSPVLRDIHDERTSKRYAGTCEVRCGQGWIVRAMARVASLPPSNAHTPVTIAIERSVSGETWTRRFGEHQMQSVLSKCNRFLEERLGAVTFRFELIADTHRIEWKLQQVRVLFIPLPRSWFTGFEAVESSEDGRYCFDVKAGILGLGLLVHYKGWLAEHER